MVDTAQRARFEAVVAEAYEPLQRYLRRRCAADDVDEVLNDTLLVVWRRLDDLPAESVLPWCYGVARRTLSNHRRGSGRRSRLMHRVTATAAVSESAVWESDADVALHEALERLPERDREVVRLWAWEQLEPREIAAVLDTTANAISVRLGRIRNRLESELTRQDVRTGGHELHEGHQELEP